MATGLPSSRSLRAMCNLWRNSGVAEEATACDSRQLCRDVATVGNLAAIIRRFFAALSDSSVWVERSIQGCFSGHHWWMSRRIYSVQI